MSDDFAHFCDAVMQCSSYTTDKHKAFRSFVCLALKFLFCFNFSFFSNHLLHVWVYIIASSPSVVSVYFQPGALLVEVLFLFSVLNIFFRSARAPCTSRERFATSFSRRSPLPIDFGIRRQVLLNNLFI